MMLFAPKPRVIVKFPRPDTDEHVYKAADGSCFRIKARKVPCKASKGTNILPQPVHEEREDVSNANAGHSDNSNPGIVSQITRLIM